MIHRKREKERQILENASGVLEWRQDGGKGVGGEWGKGRGCTGL